MEKKTSTRDPDRGKDLLVFSTGAILGRGHRATLALSRWRRLREGFSSYGQTPALQRTQVKPKLGRGTDQSSLYFKDQEAGTEVRNTISFIGPRGVY